VVVNRRLAAAAGLGLDRLLGEPPAALHPVAAFGRLATTIEHRVYRDQRAAGVLHTSLGAAVGLGAGLMVRSPAVAVGTAAAGRELRRVAGEIGAHLSAEDLVAARRALPALVGRDPSLLDESGVAAAVIESLAENTVDAVFASALWGATLGAPGALGHRALNTLDAMVGHHSERYEHFGWAAARLDDIAAWAPARAFALTVLLARPSSAATAWSTLRRDAGRHPSPNAGVAEAVVAGALGLELGGPLRYGDRAEDRPRLGRGRRPMPSDIGRAIRWVDDAERILMVALATCGAVEVVAQRRARRTRLR
jgi:adenosylcobinamide-phosphate synthase